jgi:tRNA 2-selenouridine synthase
MPSALGVAHHLPLTAHPHDLGVQDFGSYALIVDARSASRFAEDHIPGAASAPLAGRTGGTPRRAVPERMRELASSLPAGSTVLLYAHAGEQVLDASASWLRGEGLVVDVLAGGWRSYRRWVKASLEVLPRMFQFRVISSSMPERVAAVLDAFVDLGEQVIDLGQAQSGSQAAFESKLLNDLRHRETDRRLWIGYPSTANPRVKLSPALSSALRRAPQTTLFAEPRHPLQLSDALVAGEVGNAELRAIIERFLFELDAQSRP